MIYNIQTFCTYGYWPDTDLSPQSVKPILAACNICGDIRVTTKNAYRDLCGSCAASIRNIERWKDSEFREKMGVIQLEVQNTPEAKYKNKNSQLDRYAKVDAKTELVGHHIAYDFNRPEAFIVYVTRSFHGSIHNPKGVQRHLHGYSLID